MTCTRVEALGRTFQCAAASTCESTALGPHAKTGGQPVPLAPELPMADGENASVEAKEAVGADALLYACVADARLEHLSAGHDSVLPSGDGRQAPVRRGLGAFSFHLTR